MIDNFDFIDIKCPLGYSNQNKSKKVICIVLFPNDKSFVECPPLVCDADFKKFMAKVYLACLKNQVVEHDWEETSGKPDEIYYNITVAINGDIANIAITLKRYLCGVYWNEVVDRLERFAEFNEKLIAHNLPLLDISATKDINEAINVGNRSYSTISGKLNISISLEKLRSIIPNILNYLENDCNCSCLAKTSEEFEKSLELIFRKQDPIFAYYTLESKLNEMIGELVSFYDGHIRYFHEECEKDESFQKEFDDLRRKVYLLANHVFEEKLYSIIRYNYPTISSAYSNICKFFPVGDYIWNETLTVDKLIKILTHAEEITYKELDVYNLDSTDSLIDYLSGLQWADNFNDLYCAYYDEDKTDGYSYNDD